MKKTLIIIVALLLVACSSNTPSQKEVLKVATSSGYAPYEMIDPTNGELIGFDIELGQLIADKLGKEIEWNDMSFDGVIASLSTGAADMAIAGLSPDPDRDALFSNSYYNSEDTPFFVLTKTSNQISKTSDIQNKTVGVQIATIQESAAKQIEEQFNLTIDARDAYNVMVQEVLLNRIDFLIMESMVAQKYIDEYDELMMFELDVQGLENLSGNAIAIPTSNSQLLDEVNLILDELKADGTLDELVWKWFTSDSNQD